MGSGGGGSTTGAVASVKPRAPSKGHRTAAPSGHPEMSGCGSLTAITLGRASLARPQQAASGGSSDPADQDARPPARSHDCRDAHRMRRRDDGVKGADGGDMRMQPNADDIQTHSDDNASGSKACEDCAHRRSGHHMETRAELAGGEHSGGASVPNSPREPGHDPNTGLRGTTVRGGRRATIASEGGRHQGARGSIQRSLDDHADRVAKRARLGEPRSGPSATERLAALRRRVAARTGLESASAHVTKTIPVSHIHSPHRVDDEPEGDAASSSPTAATSAASFAAWHTNAAAPKTQRLLG